MCGKNPKCTLADALAKHTADYCFMAENSGFSTLFFSPFKVENRQLRSTDRSSLFLKAAVALEMLGLHGFLFGWKDPCEIDETLMVARCSCRRSSVTLQSRRGGLMVRSE